MFTTNCGMQYEPLLATGRFVSAAGLPSLLTSFGLGGRHFERLGNVLDCEGWILS